MKTMTELDEWKEVAEFYGAEIDRLRDVMRQVSAMLKSPDGDLMTAVAIAWRNLDAALEQ